MQPHNEGEEVFLIYDGECPICQLGVNNFCLKEGAGTLQTIDKRTEHNNAVVQEIKAQAMDINQGMVIKYRGKFYQGSDALHIMSTLGRGKNIASRISIEFFKSPRMARLCYPFLRGGRNILLKLKGIPQIES